VLGVLCVLAVQPAAHADEVQERFDAAASLMAAERNADAAEALEALAREAPEHALAPEALFTAAQLREESLADPASALALYRQIVARYPDSRPALAAGRRAERLGAMGGDGDEGMEAQRRFAVIRQGYPDRSQEETIALAEALLADHPRWAGAPRVALWLAELDLGAGRYRSAHDRYVAAAARFADPDVRFDALIGAGDAAVRLGDMTLAEEHYRALDARDPARQALIDQALRDLGVAQNYARWQVAALVVGALGLLALLASLLVGARSARGAARALWPPPVEVLYLFPVAGFLSVVAYTDYQGFGPAITAVSIGGVLIAWLSGAALAARRGRGMRLTRAALLHALAAAAVIPALVFIALYRTRLLDPVLDTLRYGPER
jgi:tetratricopeptide (TPR) repeat protein